MSAEAGLAELEAIEAKGSITAAARYLGMCYRRAWLLVQDINNTLQQPIQHEEEQMAAVALR